MKEFGLSVPADRKVKEVIFNAICVKLNTGLDPDSNLKIVTEAKNDLSLDPNDMLAVISVYLDQGGIKSKFILDREGNVSLFSDNPSFESIILGAEEYLN